MEQSLILWVGLALVSAAAAVGTVASRPRPLSAGPPGRETLSSSRGTRETVEGALASFSSIGLGPPVAGGPKPQLGQLSRPGWGVDPRGFMPLPPAPGEARIAPTIGRGGGRHFRPPAPDAVAAPPPPGKPRTDRNEEPPEEQPVPFVLGDSVRGGFLGSTSGRRGVLALSLCDLTS